ncbi:MAG TPA: hypothetical protein VJS65_09920, partial [Verrucomicrobiae bacterium]|nr:hypothetical protein [Verrucomicrobiae bacterium]
LREPPAGLLTGRPAIPSHSCAGKDIRSPFERTGTMASTVAKFPMPHQAGKGDSDIERRTRGA